MLRNIDKKSFNGYVNSLHKQRRDFKVFKKRGKRELRIWGKTTVLNKGKKSRNLLDKETNRKFITTCGQISKQVNKFIVDNDFTVEEIKQHYPSVAINRKKYKTLAEGEEFYYVDVAHCFWRISFLKGYITEKLYKKVLEDPKSKEYRNMALACIVAEASMEYHFMDEDCKMHVFEVQEDKKLHQRIYNNIRFTAYNLMGDTGREVEKYFIGFKTDGIMVTEGGLEKVKKLISAQNFEYTVKKCIKIDELIFYYGDEKKVKKL